MMKRTAIFINTARGKLVHEQDLIYALEKGEIAGAFLDVLTTEPFEKENPLFHMDNVLVTPHCDSNTGEALARSGLHAAMDIDRFFRGEPVRWAVNKV